MAYSLERNLKDADGVPIVGAQTYVYTFEGALADVVTADGDPATNPVVSGAGGYSAIFVAAVGRYTLKHYWAGRERLIEFAEVQGSAVSELPASTDVTLSSNTDSAVPTVRAAKSYVDATFASVFGATIYATWAKLSAATGMTAGDQALVLEDAGTHTDPVTSATVNNTGIYIYSASPAGWERVADTEAVKAADSADQAQAWAEGTLPGGAGTKSAKEWAGDSAASAATAEAARISAESARDATIAVASDPSGLERPEFSSVAALLADTLITDNIVGRLWRAGQFTYQEAADAATDHNITTAGGTKLYILPVGDGWYPLEAMGYDKTGTDDALPLLNQLIAWLKARGLVKIWLGSNGTLRLSADPTDYKFVHTASSDLTIVGGTTTDFAVNNQVNHYLTDPAASGSIGGSGNNASWKQVYSGSPCLHVFERTDVPGQPVVWGTLQANHDGFIIAAGPTASSKNLVLGVKEDQEDEGCFEGISLDLDNIIFNPARRNWNVRFYSVARSDSIVMNGNTGEVTFNGTSTGSIIVKGNNADSVGRVVLQNDARNYEVRIHSNDEFRIVDATAGAARLRMSVDGEFAFGNVPPVAGIKLAVPAGSAHIFRGYDAAGTTEQITIQADGDIFNVNGTYGTASDARLKTDIRAASSQWDDIKALKLKNYKLKSLGVNAPDHLGVIAQDLIADGMDGLIATQSGAGGQDYYVVKYSILYLKALGALQEAMARIEALEAQIAPASN